MSKSEIYTGKMKFCNLQKGFGFITMKLPGGDTEDLFFNIRALNHPFDRPFKGDRVTFRIKGHRNGLQAYDIERIVT